MISKTCILTCKNLFSLFLWAFFVCFFGFWGFASLFCGVLLLCFLFYFKSFPLLRGRCCQMSGKPFPGRWRTIVLPLSQQTFHPNSGITEGCGIPSHFRCCWKCKVFDGQKRQPLKMLATIAVLLEEGPTCTKPFRFMLVYLDTSSRRMEWKICSVTFLM